MKYSEAKINIHKTDLHMAKCEDMLIGYYGPRRAAVDLGAHVGTRSLWLATNGGFDTVWAVEPAIDNFNLLLQNIKENGFKKRIFPVLGAVDIGNRITVFRYAGINRGQCSTSYRDGAAPAAYSVMTICLEDLLEQIPEPIDFLKMDIEGGEYSIFANAHQAEAALAEVNCLFIETHGPNSDFFDPQWFEELGYNPDSPNNRLMEHIKDCGFTKIKLTHIGQIMAQRS